MRPLGYSSRRRQKIRARHVQRNLFVIEGEFNASEIVTITVNEVNVAPVLDPIGSMIGGVPAHFVATLYGGCH
jgi:hypothetical protein